MTTLTLTDRAGNTKSFALPSGSFQTLNERGGFPSSADTGRVVVRDLLVANLAAENYNPQGSGSFFSTTAIQLGDFDELFYPASDVPHVVIGQIVRQDSNGDWNSVPQSELLHSGLNSTAGAPGPAEPRLARGQPV